MSKKAQIEQYLKETFFPMIPKLETGQAQGWSEVQHEKNRLSRSLSALAIASLADVEPAEAAYSIINGFDDNGIDAIHFDRANHILWIVQAKAGNAPNMGENKKFCDGIRDLIAQRFEKFRVESFTRLQPDVESALEQPGKIIGCNIYLEGSLGSHAIADLENLKQELNQFTERFDWRDLNVNEIHHWLTQKQAIQPIDIKLILENWHRLSEPRRAFYGLVKAQDLAELYQEYGKQLFQKNIRYYLGAEAVNQDIATTIRKNPTELFYLNNGLTITCSEVCLPSGYKQESSCFTLKGFSIVNGAQTVGTIANVFRENQSVSAEAKLLVTIIEVGDSSELGASITKARNTQNAVKDLYFAALDPNQERLRQECMVSGVVYHYRPSAERGQDDISIEEAAIALACFSDNSQLVVVAKQDISQLYQQYYEQLFNDRLLGLTVCRYVKIYQYLDAILAASERAEVGRRKAFYRHGRYFISNIFARCHRRLLNTAEINLANEDQETISRSGLEIAELIYGVLKSRFLTEERGCLAIFRNLGDVRDLTGAVMQALSRQNWLNGGE